MVQLSLPSALRSFPSQVLVDLRMGNVTVLSPDARSYFAGAAGETAAAHVQGPGGERGGGGEHGGGGGGGADAEWRRIAVAEEAFFLTLAPFTRASAAARGAASARNPSRPLPGSKTRACGRRDWQCGVAERHCGTRASGTRAVRHGTHMKAFGLPAADSRAQGGGLDLRRDLDGLDMRRDPDALDMSGRGQEGLGSEEGHRLLVHVCPLFGSCLPALLRVECPQNANPRTALQTPHSHSTLHTPHSTHHTPHPTHTAWRSQTACDNVCDAIPHAHDYTHAHTRKDWTRR